MTNKNIIYDRILESIADDYEAPHTIAGDIARDLGRDVTEHEVLDALMALANNGKVQAFRYDESSNQYIEVAVLDVESPESHWFFARS